MRPRGIVLIFFIVANIWNLETLVTHRSVPVHLYKEIFFLQAEQSVNVVFTQLTCQYNTSLLCGKLQNIGSFDLFIE